MQNVNDQQYLTYIFQVLDVVTFCAHDLVDDVSPHLVPVLERLTQAETFTTCVQVPILDLTAALSCFYSSIVLVHPQLCTRGVSTWNMSLTYIYFLFLRCKNKQANLMPAWNEAQNWPLCTILNMPCPPKLLKGQFYCFCYQTNNKNNKCCELL